MDTGPTRPPSLGGSSEYNPPQMHSPPPLRRASLPLYASSYTPNPDLPLLSTPARTPGLCLEALEGRSFLAHLDDPGREPPMLHADTRSVPSTGLGQGPGPLGNVALGYQNKISTCSAALMQAVYRVVTCYAMLYFHVHLHYPPYKGTKHQYKLYN